MDVHRLLSPLAVAALAAGVAASAAASDLSYTYVDFGALGVSTDIGGTRTPTAGQTVAVTGGDGDGLTVAGSLGVGQRFYIGAAFESAVVDVDALVASPLATASLAGNFDYVVTRATFGYVQPIGNKLDVIVEASYDSVDYDFGNFAGESFDTDDAGAGLRLGLRFQPKPSLELFAAVHGSQVGEVDLSTGLFTSGTAVDAGVRWYFFNDLGVGVDYRSGDVESLAVTLRFGFGGLRAGSN